MKTLKLLTCGLLLGFLGPGTASEEDCACEKKRHDVSTGTFTNCDDASRMALAKARENCREEGYMLTKPFETCDPVRFVNNNGTDSPKYYIATIKFFCE